LSIFAIFNTTDSFSQEEEEFFGIFPDDYYDPRDYGESGDMTTVNPLDEEGGNTDDFTNSMENGQTTEDNLLSNTEITNLNFIAAGDWACNKETQKTVEKITHFQPELVVGLGDYTFEEPSPQCWFDISKPIDDIMKIAIGNHDLDYQSSYHQLINHYNLQEPYYSFNFHNIHFVTISTEHPFEEDSRQYEFIKNDLEESLQDPSILWRIVFLHKPMYTSAKFDEKASEDLKNTFHELFERYNVDLVLSGHTQYYQRSLPLSYNNDDPLYPVVMNGNNKEYTNQNGIIFLTVGTAGDELHNIEYLLPYYIVQEKKHGFLNFDLTNNGQTLTGAFHDTDDLNILDKFVITKDKTGKKTFSEEQFDPYNSSDNINNFHYTSEDTGGKEKGGIINKNQIFLTSNSHDNNDKAQNKLKS
jgi:hypothetical protein